MRFANWLWLAHRVPGRPALLANLLLQEVAFVGAVALIALACRQAVPGWVRRWRPQRLLWGSPLWGTALLAAVGLAAGGAVARGPSLIDDASSMAICGARAMVAGHDPYRVPEIACLDRLHVSVLGSTPFRRGPLAGVRGYPTPPEVVAAAALARRQGARSTLFTRLAKPPLDPAVMVPVARAPATLRALWTMLPCLVLLVAVLWAAGALWPVAAALFALLYFIHGSVLDFGVTGNVETFSYALMGLSVLWMRRPALSAICLGLAISLNELAWFVLPAYVLLTLGREGWWRRWIALGVTVAVAVGPWLLLYPDAPATIWSALRAPTFPLGSGPIELVLADFVPEPPQMLPLTAAGLVMLGTFVAGLMRPRWRVAAAVLLVAGFWFSWRSLDEYLAQIPLLALVAVLAMLDRDAPASGGEPPGQALRPAVSGGPAA